MGEEQIVMFEESGVGAEEVVSSNDYNLCFVDTGEVSVTIIFGNLTLSILSPLGGRRWIVSAHNSHVRGPVGRGGGGGDHGDHQDRDPDRRGLGPVHSHQREPRVRGGCQCQEGICF